MTRSTLRAVDAAEGCQGFVTTLVLGCAAGDEVALGALFDLFYPIVHARLVVLDPDGPVDDRVVDTFQRVWQEAPRFRTDEDAVAWVMQRVSDTAPYDVPSLAS